MKRYHIALLVLAAVILFCFSPAAAAGAENTIAAPLTAEVLVNGEQQSFAAYNINGSNYFKLRDIAFALNGTKRQFEVEWDQETNAVFLTAWQGYSAAGGEMRTASDLTAKAAASVDAGVYLNGDAVSLAAYNIGGSNYFKLRDLGRCLGFGVNWNADTGTIELISTKGYLPEDTVRGIHTAVYDDDTAQKLIDSIQALSAQGINLIIVEVGYSYQYTSHPELAEEYGLSFEYAREIVKEGEAAGIDIVPEIACLGHQSWEESTGALLTVYPELDETPGQYPENEGIYCRSWCPLNEKVNPIVFDLIDELMDAFQADAVHVGLDEVFIIGDANCPRCAGKDPGDLFAKQINDLYQHIAVEKGATMFMWSDRLLDGEAMGDVYGEWESSYNGTDTAVDKIPKDIILCDWHYDVLADYPSIEYLAKKGFRLLTASYNNAEAAEAFVQATAAYRKTDADVLGHLYTTWEDIGNEELPGWFPMTSTIHHLLPQ